MFAGAVITCPSSELTSKSTAATSEAFWNLKNKLFYFLYFFGKEKSECMIIVHTRSKIVIFLGFKVFEILYLHLSACASSLIACVGNINYLTNINTFCTFHI